MSLNYTDKNTDNRLDPSPAAPDIHFNPMALGTTSSSPRASGTQTSAKVTYKDDTITVNDGANDRIVIGRLPDGSFGIVVSQPGVNVSDIFA